MPNMKQKIGRHNNKVIKRKKTQEQPQAQQPQQRPNVRGRRANPYCSCTKFICPLDRKCEIEKDIVYHAEITDKDDNVEHYTGMTAQKFKQRYRQHRNLFMNTKAANETELSKHIWKLKETDPGFNHEVGVKWSVLDRGQVYNTTSKKCNVCLKEKFHILFHPQTATLNKRHELWTPCPHKRFKMLSCIK